MALGLTFSKHTLGTKYAPGAGKGEGKELVRIWALKLNGAGFTNPCCATFLLDQVIQPLWICFLCKMGTIFCWVVVRIRKK